MKADEDLRRRFGETLRRRRKAIGIGQEKLAHKANVHRTHVSLLERGERLPSLMMIKKLAGALDTTMSKLIEDLERLEKEEEGTKKKSKSG